MQSCYCQSYSFRSDDPRFIWSWVGKNSQVKLPGGEDIADPAKSIVTVDLNRLGYINLAVALWMYQAKWVYDRLLASSS